MPLPSDASLDDVKVKIRESYTNPNIGKIQQAVLKDGPRAFRIATLFEIVDPKTGSVHHHSLRIDSIDRTKAGWFAKPDKSIRLEGEDPDEIEHLSRFLRAIEEGTLTDKTGDLHLIGSEDYAKLEHLLGVLPNLSSSDKLALVRTVLSQLEGKPSVVEEFVAAFQGGNAQTIRNIAVAARAVAYQAACKELQRLVEADGTTEQELQQHLKSNPWMFGSEYSELLDRRTWTRDDKLDFMLRRTVDGYIEIIEIKTAFKDALFIHDASHDSYHPSAKLSPVLGQVIRYIEEVERNRDSILAKDKEDTLKIRARVIIGRSGDDRNRAALRNLNAHLNRIEVITYDQLLHIACRVLAVFAAEERGEDAAFSPDHEPPF